ncbi:MAG TPA: hypothetical protein EYH55_03065 [Methanothermococcus okinawensis]|uniref:Uncharacterized protein n=1 Tax=Methanothermococcus okinawensis TaxID=155863 RepID=A0A832ZYG3_9EURY|nr:hypothetical protein [Methanothermococcus okinawensis]
MKKFTIFLVFTILPLSLAWDDCPYGITNSSCQYPGYCSLYVDTNNNNICDRSEPAPNDTSENNDQNEKSLIDRVIEFLFMEVNLREILFNLLKKVFVLLKLG